MPFAMKNTVFPIFQHLEASTDQNPVPVDLELASRMFRANCGPASFAALIGSLILDIIRFFPQFPASPHTSIPHMKRALEQSGVQYNSRKSWPNVGLCLIEFTGPWTKRGQYSEAAKHRHWVATIRGQIYDVNANQWLQMDVWEQQIMPHLVEAHPGRTGWRLLKSYEVLPAANFLPEFPLAGLSAF